jgi:hypothetical protein
MGGQSRRRRRAWRLIDTTIKNDEGNERFIGGHGVGGGEVVIDNRVNGALCGLLLWGDRHDDCDYKDTWRVAEGMTMSTAAEVETIIGDGCGSRIPRILLRGSPTLNPTTFL